MIGDVVGFAAATYLRGVGLVHVPTMLLAQVDSSIGGKVGINHALGKNLIGSFHQPLAVFADPEVLPARRRAAAAGGAGTLPRREFRAGLYEVVKYGMIADSGLFERVGRDLRAIVRREQEALAAVIADSCRIKARVVSEDERESGLRRILNFGHTAGHAIEAVTKYRRFRHGEAVAYGMLAVADLGVRRGVFAEAERSALADRARGRAVPRRLLPLPLIRCRRLRQSGCARHATMCRLAASRLPVVPVTTATSTSQTAARSGGAAAVIPAAAVAAGGRRPPPRRRRWPRLRRHPAAHRTGGGSTAVIPAAAPAALDSVAAAASAWVRAACGHVPPGGIPAAGRPGDDRHVGIPDCRSFRWRRRRHPGCRGCCWRSASAASAAPLAAPPPSFGCLRIPGQTDHRFRPAPSRNERTASA